MPKASSHTSTNAIEQIRQAAHPAPRISLTELARSTKWRESMTEYAVVELCDRSETAGYLVSAVGMQEILDRLEALEQELEQAQLEAIISQRANATDWKSGADLAHKASGHLQKRIKQLEGAHVS